MKQKLKILEDYYGKNEVAEALGISTRQYARIKKSGESTETIRILIDELVNKIRFISV